MNLSQRIADLERAAEDAGVGEPCPGCGGVPGRITLLPMYRPDGSRREYGPCAVCGSVPIRLRPMRLDGDAHVTAEDEA